MKNLRLRILSIAIALFGSIGLVSAQQLPQFGYGTMDSIFVDKNTPFRSWFKEAVQTPTASNYITGLTSADVKWAEDTGKNYDAFSTIHLINITAASMTGYPGIENIDEFLLTLGGSLTTLDCSNNGLTSLNTTNDAWTNASALKFLDCSNNKLSSITLKNVIPLEEFDCSGNAELVRLVIDNSFGSAATTINLPSNLKNLTITNTQNYSFASLSLLSLTALEQLTITNNKKINALSVENMDDLTSLTITNNAELNWFVCQNNPVLSSLTISNNPGLLNFNCHNNDALTKLDVSGLPSLTDLNCSDNDKLTSLIMANNPKLGSLFCINNDALTSLSISSLPSLQYVSCINNDKLTSLTITNNPKLSVFGCEDNDVLTALNVSNLPVLNYFTCTGNEKLSSLTITNNPKLEWLNLDNDNNSLKTITIDNVGNTTTSGFAIVPTISNSTENLIVKNSKLGGLDIAGTNLKTIEVTGNSGSSSFSIDIKNNNKLTSVKFEDNKNIATLNVNSNENLSSLTVKNNPQLETLNCSENKLTSLDISGLSELSTLNCGEQSTNSLTVAMTPEQYVGLNWTNVNYTVQSGSATSGNPHTGIGAQKSVTKFVDVDNNKILATAADFISAVDNGIYNNENLTLFSVVSSENSVFTDPELKKWISYHKKAFTNYGVKVNSDGSIAPTKANLAALAAMTSLEITDSNDMLAIDTYQLNGGWAQHYYNIRVIDDLIRNMPNLTYLNCSGNKLFSLDLSNNKNLEELSCVKNKLTYLDISETKIVDRFIGRDQADPFKLRLTKTQYRMIQDDAAPPYPSWTTFDIVDDGSGGGYVEPTVRRAVNFAPGEGVTTNLSIGTYYVVSGNDFKFTYTVKDGYDASNVRITTGYALYDSNLTVEPGANGVYTVTIYSVRQSISVGVTATKLSSGEVGNVSVADNAVWSAGSNLYVRTSEETVLNVYNLTGALHKTEQLSGGQSVYNMPRGVYIVKLGDVLTQKVVIK